MDSNFQELQNDEHVEQLTSKAGILKEITLQINEEVHYQNKLIEQMHTDFGRTGFSLSNTMKRLGALSKTQNGCWMCYLILFTVCCFFILYLVVKSR